MGEATYDDLGRLTVGSKVKSDGGVWATVLRRGKPYRGMTYGPDGLKMVMCYTLTLRVDATGETVSKKNVFTRPRDTLEES